MSTVDPTTPPSDNEVSASQQGATREPPPQPKVPTGGRGFLSTDESETAPAGDPQPEG
jgi:hypothetical protein